MRLSRSDGNWQDGCLGFVADAIAVFGFFGGVLVVWLVLRSVCP
jgi:hypothetical protein